MKPYYDEDGITIYHGDCREVMRMCCCGAHNTVAMQGTHHDSCPEYGPVVVVTDPPYGIGHSSNRVVGSTTATWVRREIAGDDSTKARDDILSRFPEWACFGQYGADPKGFDDVLIWDKGPASGMGDLSWPWKRSWECVFLRGGGWSGSRDEGVLKNMWSVSRASMGRAHPNEKPVALMTYLISKHPAQHIIDPFMGSGATLRAAKDLGRRAIGIEIEERYCEIAVKRLAQRVLEL